MHKMLLIVLVTSFLVSCGAFDNALCGIGDNVDTQQDDEPLRTADGGSPCVVVNTNGQVVHSNGQ